MKTQGCGRNMIWPERVGEEENDERKHDGNSSEVRRWIPTGSNMTNPVVSRHQCCFGAYASVFRVYGLRHAPDHAI